MSSPFTLDAAQTIQGVAGTASVITCFIDGIEKDTTTGANTFKVLAAQAFLASAVGVLATVPTGKAWLPIIHLSNTSGVPVTGIALFVGGTSLVNRITGSFTIPANGKTIITGDTFQTVDANGIVTTGSSTAAKNYAARIYARLTFR